MQLATQDKAVKVVLSDCGPSDFLKVVPSDKSGPFGFLKSGHLNLWDLVLFVPPAAF